MASVGGWQVSARLERRIDNRKIEIDRPKDRYNSSKNRHMDTNDHYHVLPTTLPWAVDEC